MRVRFRSPTRCNEKFDDLDYLYDIGDISLNISGCMNSCGHHHVANIGILGVDKNNEEWYQITVGGQQGNAAAIGKVIGPSFYAQEVPLVIAALDRPSMSRSALPDERFIDTLATHRHGTVQGAERTSAATAGARPRLTAAKGRSSMSERIIRKHESIVEDSWQVLRPR
jgi:sulfite reductase beta subunit-like hemoprotein